MRISILDIQKMKQARQPIPMLTAYDVTSARLGEAAGAPMLLVGDSLGMVVQGHETPIPVTLEHILYHTEIVARVTTQPLIVGDMPFMTYKASPEQALINAGRVMQVGKANAVKLEGGAEIAPTIARVVSAGIPVMAHIGLTPQSVYEMGGFRVQGRDLDGARRLLRDAEAVQAAGAFAVVLETIPAPLAALITERLTIPTIGIGAGAGCDGQVQVFHDLLGLFAGKAPRHAHQFADAGTLIQKALTEYVQAVQARAFPTEENSFTMKDEVLNAIRNLDGVDDAAD